LKSKLQRTLGKSIWEDDANARRLEFTGKLVEAFPGEPIFDLLRRSIDPSDGTKEEYAVGGGRCRCSGPGTRATAGT
jgi:hypothetical protein